MTHEELLADIESKFGLNSIYGGSEEIKNALRAVVELHKPSSTGECGDPDCCGEADIICSECHLNDYPCPTIQAIEKELK